MAAAVLSQCMMGAVFDITSWMGMERIKNIKKTYPIPQDITGGHYNHFILAIDVNVHGGCFLGFLEAPSWDSDGLNSNFSARKGAFFSACKNVISGLAGITLLMLLVKPSTSIVGLKVLSSTPLYIILLGGIPACIVVVSTNTIIHKLPGAISSVLLSSCQILMEVLLDAFLPSLLIGAIIMLIGILIGG